MKKTITMLTALAAATALTLAAPTAAFAAPFIPDGSVPYDRDTICVFTGDHEYGDPSTDTTCAPIPTGTWQQTTIPDATTPFLTNANVGNLDWVGQVASPGSWHTGDPGTNGMNFIVQPTNPATTPFIASASLNLFGHTSETTITGVTAYFVADSSILNENDPFTGVTGTRTTEVTDGTAAPVTITDEGNGNYDLSILAPSPTWTHSTNGTLNAYGWSGQLVIVVTGENAQGTMTQVTRSGLNFYSAFLYDITEFVIEEPLNGNTIGVTGTSYGITGSTIGIAPPVVTPPAPEPPVVVPPVVEPPVVEPPVTTPEPEPTPYGPPVEAGGDGAPTLQWLPIAGIAFLTIGLLPLFAVLRRKEHAAQ